VIRAESRAKIGIVSAVGLLDPSMASSSLKDLPRYQASCNSRVLSALSTSQCYRLRQIERQFHGGSFFSPSEQSLLKLTAEQRRKADEIRSFDKAKAGEIQKSLLRARRRLSAATSICTACAAPRPEACSIC